MIEQDSENLNKGITNITKVLERDVQKGRMTNDQKNKLLENYYPSINFQDISEADMIIEAVYEEMTVKQTVFKKIDSLAKDGAVLASNTSYLDIDQIAAVTQRPKDVIGLHFFSPANIMRLLEIVIPSKVSDEVVATGLKLAKMMKKYLFEQEIVTDLLEIVFCPPMVKQPLI